MPSAIEREIQKRVNKLRDLGQDVTLDAIRLGGAPALPDAQVRRYLEGMSPSGLSDVETNGAPQDPQWTSVVLPRYGAGAAAAVRHQPPITMAWLPGKTKTNPSDVPRLRITVNGKVLKQAQLKPGSKVAVEIKPGTRQLRIRQARDGERPTLTLNTHRGKVQGAAWPSASLLFAAHLLREYDVVPMLPVERRAVEPLRVEPECIILEVPLWTPA